MTNEQKPPFFMPGGSSFGLKLGKERKDKVVSLFQELAVALHANHPDGSSGSFFSDNILTFCKTLGFLRDEKLVNAAEKNFEDDQMSRSIIWRTHTLCWAANACLNIPGDFVELGCYKGKTANCIADYVDFNSTKKKYFLYDVFNHSEDASEVKGGLYEEVVLRFKNYPNVEITKGEVPGVLKDKSPKKISFMHIDMNSVDAEIGALEILFDRVSTGGIIILDDYGWKVYEAQYKAEKDFMKERGYEILEMPTGQGMVLKR